MFKVTLVAFLLFSASFSSSIVDNLLSDNSAKRAMLTFWKKDIFLLKLTKHFQSAHAQYSICTSYLQLIDICMQLFAGELTNQNQEYYKVNDNMSYLHGIMII